MASIYTEASSGQQPATIQSSDQQFTPYPRMLSLDVLRGVAVISALFVSIWAFGGFSINQQNGLLIQSKGWNYRLFGTMSLLLDGKMRALISLVFGAGMCLFLAKNNMKVVPAAADFFIRRQLWLIAFGLINGLLFLWTGDVLFHLGIMGILLFPLVRLSARGLLTAAILTTIIYSAKNYWNYADDRTAHQKFLAVTAVEKKIAADKLKKNTSAAKSKTDSLSKDQKDDKQAWEGIASNFKYDPKKDAGENKAMRTMQYGKLWNHMAPVLQSKESQWMYSIGIWDFAGMILLGMAVFRMGFFNMRFSGTQYLLIAVTGLTAGLLSGWFRLYYNQVALHDYDKYVSHHLIPFDLFFPFERAFMAIGYASLVIALMNVNFLKFLWRALAAAGRMSLTNYLLQSILCNLFFTGFGMGYFGMLKQYQLYFFVVEISMVQIVFSIFWLRHYQTGPVEWLWRCLTHGKWLPNKMLPPQTTTSALPALS